MENYKYEMLCLLRSAAKVWKVESQRLFDHDIALFWQQQKRNTTTYLLNLLEQRLSNQTKKVQCSFEYAKSKKTLLIE